ncbi:MAG: hypothetical protein GF364_10960 [Candidatus Lokiarchaeota archaeon]|nr:hypothetical protein [Candidatus Lokiarchaeota archaeon]
MNKLKKSNISSILQLLSYFILLTLVLLWSPILSFIRENISNIDEYILLAVAITIGGFIGALLSRLSYNTRSILLVVLTLICFVLHIIFVTLASLLISLDISMDITFIFSAIVIISTSVCISNINSMSTKGRKKSKFDITTLIIQTSLLFGIVIPVFFADFPYYTLLVEITSCFFIAIYIYALKLYLDKNKHSNIIAIQKEEMLELRKIVVSVFSPYAWFYGLAFVGIFILYLFLFNNPSDIIDNILQWKATTYILDGYLIMILLIIFLITQFTTNYILHYGAKKYCIVDKKITRKDSGNPKKESQEKNGSSNMSIQIDWKSEIILFIKRFIFLIVIVIVIGALGYLIYIKSSILEYYWVSFIAMLLLMDFLAAILFHVLKNWYFDQF